MSKITACIVLSFWLFASQAAIAAGFNCDKANSLQEKLICKSPLLSTLDNQLNTLYRQNKNKISEQNLLYNFENEQSHWLNNRNFCKTVACLTASYPSRIKDLQLALSYDFTYRGKLISTACVDNFDTRAGGDEPDVGQAIDVSTCQKVSNNVGDSGAFMYYKVIGKTQNGI